MLCCALLSLHKLITASQWVSTRHHCFMSLPQNESQPGIIVTRHCLNVSLTTASLLHLTASQWVSPASLLNLTASQCVSNRHHCYTSPPPSESQPGIIVACYRLKVSLNPASLLHVTASKWVSNRHHCYMSLPQSESPTGIIVTPHRLPPSLKSASLLHAVAIM